MSLQGNDSDTSQDTEHFHQHKLHKLKALSVFCVHNFIILYINGIMQYVTF